MEKKIGNVAAKFAIIPAPNSESTDSNTDYNPSLAEALSKLSTSYEPRTWQAFLRTVVDGRPTEEVAVEFQMSAVGVRQLRSRILRRLRKELQGHVRQE